MGTAGRSAPLRRTGSLLGLVGLELAAVLALHWLGRFQGLRVRWDEPAAWILSSPVQEVLGAVLRMVGLVMAYWLLASTVAYLLASLTRLPGAVRAVRWATLPVVRRVADHAVAVTLATSMVGGGTLGLAGPAAAQDRGGAGPPADKPAAAAQATSSTAAQDPPPDAATRPRRPAYVPDPAEQVPSPEADEAPAAGDEPAEPRQPSWVFEPAEQAPRQPDTPDSPADPATEPTPTTPTTTPTTPTTTPTTPTTAPTTRSTAESTTPTTTTPTTAAPTTETTAASTTGSTAAPRTTARPPAAAAPGDGTTSTGPPAPEPPPASRLRDPSYPFSAAGDEPRREAGREPGGNTGGRESDGETRRRQRYEVQSGDNLWSIARKELTKARSGGSGEPTNREVAEYWLRLIEVNRDRLWSGDPDLIYPTERIILPPVD